MGKYQSRRAEVRSGHGFEWPYLTNYLKNGRLELSNNRAERSIKPLVIDRKNFLFANTPNGNADSKFDLRVGIFYMQLGLTLTMVLPFCIQISSAISLTSRSVSFQPMQGSVMDLP